MPWRTGRRKESKQRKQSWEERGKKTRMGRRNGWKGKNERDRKMCVCGEWGWVRGEGGEGGWGK